MRITSADKQELFSLYKPGSVLEAMEELEWDLVARCGEDSDDGWCGRYTSEAQEEKLLRRAQYRGDLLIVESMAFQKGVAAALAWISERRKHKKTLQPSAATAPEGEAQAAL